MRKRLILFFVLIMTLALTACGSDEKKGYINSIESLDEKGRTLGVGVNSVASDIVGDCIKNADTLVLMSDGYTDLSSGRIDALIDGEPFLNAAIKSGNIENAVILDENITNPVDIRVGISKYSDSEALKKDVNSFIDELKSDGSLSEIYNRWVIDENYDVPAVTIPANPDKKLIVYTTGLMEPFSFIDDNNLVGMDIELIYKLSDYLNADIEIHTTDYYGVLTAVETGKCDLAFANITINPERKDIMEFSNPIYSYDIKALVRANASSNTSIFSRAKTGFIKSFITEARWQLIVKGIIATVYISLFAILLGTVFGFFLTVVRNTKVRLVKNLIKIYVSILQGTPILVILMILYYLVFGKSSLSGEIVAIIGFAMNFSAYCYTIFSSAVDAVDKGQLEAALSLGYTKKQAFSKIIFPQAAVRFLPVYKGEFISTVKTTSIVGFISVTDLTGAGDIIRSRTYDAFFPLIITAVIYFIISNLLATILKAVEFEFLPNRQNRVVKGVKEK